MRIHRRVTHRLQEQLPVGLGDGEKQMCAGEQRVPAPTRVLDRTVHHTLRGFSESARGNIEILDVHKTLPSGGECSKSQTAVAGQRDQ